MKKILTLLTGLSITSPAFATSQEVMLDMIRYIERNIGDEEAGSSAAFGAQRAGFDSRVSDQKFLFWG